MMITLLTCGVNAFLSCRMLFLIESVSEIYAGGYITFFSSSSNGLNSGDLKVSVSYTAFAANGG